MSCGAYVQLALVNPETGEPEPFGTPFCTHSPVDRMALARVLAAWPAPGPQCDGRCELMIIPVEVERP